MKKLITTALIFAAGEFTGRNASAELSNPLQLREAEYSGPAAAMVCTVNGVTHSDGHGRWAPLGRIQNYSCGLVAVTLVAVTPYAICGGSRV